MLKQRESIHSMAPSAYYEGFRGNDSGNVVSVIVVGAGPSGLMLAYVVLFVLPIKSTD